MRRHVLGLLGLALPFLAMAQTAPDLVIQGNDKKIHGDFKGTLSDYTQAIILNPVEVEPENMLTYGGGEEGIRQAEDESAFQRENCSNRPGLRAE